MMYRFGGNTRHSSRKYTSRQYRTQPVIHAPSPYHNCASSRRRLSHSDDNRSLARDPVTSCFKSSHRFHPPHSSGDHPDFDSSSDPPPGDPPAPAVLGVGGERSHPGMCTPSYDPLRLRDGEPGGLPCVPFIPGVPGVPGVFGAPGDPAVPGISVSTPSFLGVL